MGHTYYSLNEIPIPDFARINKATNIVYVRLLNKNRSGDYKRRNIGKATLSHTMIPNENFRVYYPELWNKYYNENIPEKNDYLHCGLYMSILGCVYKLGLYDVMIKTYGPEYTNAFLDYAIYSILTKSDVTMTMKEVMDTQASFSSSIKSDSWYSDIFKMINGNMRNSFLNHWIKHVKETSNLESIWICIDGSNNPCYSSKATLATKGYAKVSENINIVSYMYAVDSRNGMPIAYTAYYGSIVDKTAFDDMIYLFGQNNIKIKGVILDRGFCSENDIRNITSLGYDYVIMTSSDVLAQTTLMNKYADEIKWKTNYIVNEHGVFGIHEKTKVFSTSDIESYCYLFYDGRNGSERSLNLISKIVTTFKEAKKEISKGKNPVIPESLNQYFTLITNNESDVIDVQYNYNEWQKDIDKKGFSTIISSLDVSPSDIDRIYNLRDVSEKVFAQIKNQLGFNVFRVSGDDSILNKMALCFIISIIRQSFVNVSKTIKIPTNTTIAELNKVHMILSKSDDYVITRREPKKVSTFIAQYDMKTEHMEKMCDDYNRREKDASIIRKFPEIEKVKRGRKPKIKDANVIETINISKETRGRPKGSKNKKTIEKENQLACVTKIPKKRGRPLGSRNKQK